MILTSLTFNFSRRNVCVSGKLSDIYDSQICCGLPAGWSHNVLNITCGLNTDRVALFKSPQTSMWPIYLRINELPPTLRSSLFSSAHVEYKLVPTHRFRQWPGSSNQRDCYYQTNGVRFEDALWQVGWEDVAFPGRLATGTLYIPYVLRETEIPARGSPI